MTPVRRSVLEQYQQVYVANGFERSGLFELVLARYHPVEVLYPGCLFHLTPAFYFPHLVFVDQDPAAQDFFSNREIILDFIQRKRCYRRSPFFEFIHQDFTQPLPVRLGQFDLVLALYTSGVAKACRPYLKPGGLLLTNNHRGDALDASQDSALKLVEVARRCQKKYILVDGEPARSMRLSLPGSQPTKSDLKQTHNRVEFMDEERYYIFRRKDR